MTKQKKAKSSKKNPSTWSRILALSKAAKTPYTGVLHHVGTAY